MNALELIEEVSFQVTQPGKNPITVVLADDIEQLCDVNESSFIAAVEDVKLSAVIQGINLRCFFYEIEVGEIMTLDAAIAVVSRCPEQNEFIKQVKRYVSTLVDIDFMTALSEAEVDTIEDD